MWKRIIKGPMFVSGSSVPITATKREKNRLILSVFAREIEFVEELEESSKTNQIYLDGYICKEPVYRKTPLGREIADVLPGRKPAVRKIRLHPLYLLGTQRPFRRRLQRGRALRNLGRIQSREYMKKSARTSWKKDCL